MLNARSIATPGKLDELQIESVRLRPDVIIVSESWLSPVHEDSVFCINGYNLHRQDRIGRIGGGIAVWAKSALCCKRHWPTNVFPFGDIVFLKFKYNSSLYVLCALYIPPNRAIVQDNCIIDFLTDEFDVLQNQSPDINIILSGDLNRLDTSSLESAFNLECKVTSPTRGNAILDQILVSSAISMHYPSAEVGPSLFTRRRGSHGQVFLKPLYYSSDDLKDVRIVYDCRRQHMEKFLQSLQQCSFTDLYREPDLEKKLSIFYEHLSQSFALVPRTQVQMSKKDKPWMTPYLKDLITQRWNAYRSMNFAEYNKLKLKCKEQLIECKKSWAERSRNKEKNIWSVVRETTGKTTNNPIDILIKNFPSTDRAAEAINRKLCSVFTAKITSSITNIPDNNEWCPLAEPCDIWKMLQRLSTNKATGSDGIPNRFYKIAAPFLAEPICHIVNTSIMERKVPTIFKECVVSPIPKSHPPSVEKIRPITLLSVPSKIMETVVLNSLKAFILTCFPNSQYAYRPKSNTVCALIALHDRVTSLLDDPSVAGCSLISYDFVKAFDSISHDILLQRLESLGFPAGFLLWLDSYLDNRRQRVRIKNSVSTLLNVTSGAPQGSLLGPYLFILYIHDIKPFSAETFTVQYADDLSQIVAYQHDEKIEYFEQKMIDEYSELQRWANSNNFRINSEKTKVIFFKKKYSNTLAPFVSLPFPVVTNLMLLGVCFSPDLSWQSHFRLVEVRCSKRLYILRVLKPILSHNDLWRLYESLIENVILYCAPLFGDLSSSCFQIIRKIFRRARRIICSKQCGCLFSDEDRHFRRRVSSITSLLVKAQNPSHPLHSIVPRPSGLQDRYIVPFSRTNRRRNCFTVHSSIVYNSLVFPPT